MSDTVALASLTTSVIPAGLQPFAMISFPQRSFVFFALKHGCDFSVTVAIEKPTRSPPTQGGLEIQCGISLLG